MKKNSPNYNHKKYLRSKFEEDKMIEANSFVEPKSSLLDHNKQEKVIQESVTTAAAQPSLPPNPPPPDAPPAPPMIKQLNEDDGYKYDTSKSSSEFDQAEIKTAPEIIKIEQTEDMLKTGYLPPNTFTHVKETSQQSPPAPPQSKEAAVEQSTINYLHHTPPPPQISCVPPVAEQHTTEYVSLIHQTTNLSCWTRGWNSNEEVASTTRGHDRSQLLANQCNHCESNELSERLLDAQIELARRRNQERAAKITEFTLMNNTLASLLPKPYK